MFIVVGWVIFWITLVSTVISIIELLRSVDKSGYYSRTLGVIINTGICAWVFKAIGIIG